MTDESEVEMESALPKKTKKLPLSPKSDLLKEPKRLTTKEMIDEALTELKSRRGTSLVAIKKHMELKYNVDVEKIKHIIKKYLKSSVEDGTIIQTKGVGASGSFKLAASKKEDKKIAKKKVKKTDKEDKENKNKKNKKEDNQDENEDNQDNRDKKGKPKIKKGVSKPKEEKDKKAKVDEKAKKKSAKAKTDMQTPAKKRAMMKRKSIGSIIKPPKMKPAKAKKN